MAKSVQQAIIIGGGIGGLCTAIALRQIAIDVRVYERTKAFEHVGAGLAVWANAIRALRKLGLADQVIKAGSIFRRAEIRTPSGQVLQGGDFAELERHLSEPSVGIHRAELHRILVSALSTDVLHLGMKCTGVKQHGDKVTVQWANGQTDQADCVIAADGLHSVVRQQLFPGSKLNYAGRTSWRGIAETQEKAALTTISTTWGRGNRFGFVSVDPKHVYWFAVSNIPEGQTPPTEERKEFLI
jgi:FAD-dependent urate hydroxylase